MARRSKHSTFLKESDGGDWRSRVHHISFSPTDEGEIAQWWDLQDTNWWSLCEQLIDSQWAIKISPPGSGDDYWCSVSCKGSSADWGGHTFVIKYPDMPGAVVLAYYVVFVWLDEGRVSTRPREFLSKGDKTP